MRTRRLCFLLITWLALLCIGLPMAQAAAGRSSSTDLPPCQPWPAYPEMWVSPGFASDRTLFTDSYDPYLTRYYLLKSTDAGQTWSDPIGVVDTRFLPNSITFSPNYLGDQTLYAVFDAFLMRSTDGGKTWEQIAAPPLDYPIGATLAVVSPTRLFLGYGGGPPGYAVNQGLWGSQDGGRTWERLYQGTRVVDVAVSPDFERDHTLLIGISAYHWNGGILRSTDAGRTWQPANTGLNWGSDGATQDIRFAPGYTENRTLFCRSWDSLFRSTDVGAQWHVLAAELEPYPAPGGWVDKYLISPRYTADQTLWVSSGSGPVITTDAGRTWRLRPDEPEVLAAGEACTPAGTCGVVLFGYARTTPSGTASDQYTMYKSYDGGFTWQCLDTADPPPPPTPPEIPEPAAWLLLGSGLAALAGWARRR